MLTEKLPVLSNMGGADQQRVMFNSGGVNILLAVNNMIRRSFNSFNNNNKFNHSLNRHLCDVLVLVIILEVFS